MERKIEKNCQEFKKLGKMENAFFYVIFFRTQDQNQ